MTPPEPDKVDHKCNGRYGLGLVTMMTTVMTSYLPSRAGHVIAN